MMDTMASDSMEYTAPASPPHVDVLLVEADEVRVGEGAGGGRGGGEEGHTADGRRHGGGGDG